MQKKAFTLIEVMVTMIIIAVMAGLALPRYLKSVERSHESEAMMQLESIYAANYLYYSRTRSFWPPDDGHGLNDINSELALAIVGNGMTYNCNGDASSFTCTATRNPPAASFIIRIKEVNAGGGTELDATNPCCSGGPSCPTLSGCTY